MKHQRHANQTIAAKIDARVNDTAITFAADNCVVLAHAVSNVHLTDLRAKHLTAKLLRDVVERRSRRQVGHHWTTFSLQHITGGEHERVVLTNRITVFRDDCQSIRVHVLREANVSVMFPDRLAKIAKVFGNRFRRTRKRTIGRDVNRNYLSTQSLQQLWSNDRTRAVT